jgi:hypothetical protein
MQESYFGSLHGQAANIHLEHQFPFLLALSSLTAHDKARYTYYLIGIMSDLELGIVAGSSPTMVRPIPEKPASQPHGQNEPIASGLSYNDAYRALSQLPEHYRVSDGNLAGEETIKYMHLGNILYLKSKVLKHALISDAAHRGICNGQFKPCEKSFRWRYMSLRAELIAQ